MKRLHVFIFVLSALIYGCRNGQEGIPSSIQGLFPKLAGKQIVLEELEVRKTVPMDSAVIGSEGTFRFDFDMTDAGFYVLKTSDRNLLLLQLDPGAHVEVRSDHAKFTEGYHLTGSPGSQLLLDFEQFMKSQHRRIDSIAELYYDARGQENFLEIKTELDSVYADVVEDHRQYIRQFVKKHPGSLATLIVINRSLGQNSVLDEEQDFKLYHTIDSALMKNYPDNKHTLDHHERVKEIQGRIFDRRVAEEKVLPGKKAPDIVLNDTAGNPVSLKSFTGHLTIIQFWAGWNATSRKDNKQLVQRYPSLESKGVRLLGVSLDDNAVVWKGAVKLDSLPWPQVSSLQGVHSEVAESYNLPGKLPFYYLIGRDQKIIYKNSDLDSVLIRLDQLTLQP